MRYYIGIDGGGTSCRLRMESESEVLYEKEGASSNIFAVGKDRALSSVRFLVEDCLDSLSINSFDIGGICLGSAGLGRQQDRKVFENFFSSMFPKVPFYVTTDAEILLCGGTAGKPGMALIAGTGSICIGKNEKLGSVRSGGLGWRLGDEGSAWWISQQAISRTLRSLESRDLETQMMVKLLEFFNFSSPSDFISYINDEKTEKGRIASFAPIVSIYAEKNDPLALDIVNKAVDELFSLVQSVYSRLNMSDLPLVLYGGVMEHDALIRSALTKKIKLSLPDIHVMEKPAGDALSGAIIIAKSLWYQKDDSRG